MDMTLPLTSKKQNSWWFWEPISQVILFRLVRNTFFFLFFFFLLNMSISALLTMPAFDCVDHNKLWEILKEMGIADHLTCLLRNFYEGQEAIVRTGHGTTDWFQIGKGVCQGCILSLCLFNLYAEYIMRNAGLEEVQTEIKIAGRNINNLRSKTNNLFIT